MNVSILYFLYGDVLMADEKKKRGVGKPRKFTDGEAELLYIRHEAGLTHQELAFEYGCSITTIQRTLARMKKYMESQGKDKKPGKDENKN